MIGSRARRQAGHGAWVAARQQAEVGAAAGRGRARRQGEAVRGCRARPASGASCRGVWAALRHTPGQPQQAGGGSREVEHGTAGAAA